MWDCDSRVSAHATEQRGRAARDAYLKRRDVPERFADQIIVSSRWVEPQGSGRAPDDDGRRRVLGG